MSQQYFEQKYIKLSLRIPSGGMNLNFLHQIVAIKQDTRRFFRYYIFFLASNLLFFSYSTRHCYRFALKEKIT